MSVIKCPHCEGRFDLKITPVGAPTPNPDATPLTSQALRAVLEFMEERPGRHTVADLYGQYTASREAYHGPRLTKQAFALALQRNGATRWRTGVARGYEIPEIPISQKPADVSPSTQARIDRDLMDAAIVRSAAPPATAAHGSGLGELAFLFEDPLTDPRPKL